MPEGISTNYSGTNVGATPPSVGTNGAVLLNSDDHPHQFVNPDDIVGVEAQIKPRELNYPMEGLGQTGLKSFINFRVVKETPLQIGNIATNMTREIINSLREISNTNADEAYQAGAALGEGGKDLLENAGARLSNPLGTTNNIASSARTIVDEFMQSYKDGKLGGHTTKITDQGFYVEPDTYEDQMINLYMPQFTFADGVNYDNAEMGIAGAMALAGKDGEVGDLTAAAGGLLKSTISDIMTGNGATSDVVSLGLQRLKNLPLGIGDLFVKNAGIVSAASRLKLSPNIRVVFNSTNLRSFSFSFNLIASSEKEADEIEKIIKKFRTELYPEALSAVINNTPVEIGLRFPNRFLIGLYYGFNADGTPNPIYHKIKPCYLTGLTTTYNKSQNGAHVGGKPFEVDLTLNFQESLALNRVDVELGGY